VAYVKVLRTYRFIDKDPVKDELQTILQDEGLYERLKHVAELASLAPATVQNLFHGHTRKPQNATVMGIVTAVGYERKFVRVRKLDVEKEPEFARAWNKREKAKAEKAPPRKRKAKRRATA
jgi:hypothetical protein